MSWHLQLTGRDKAKLKAAVREHQCADPANNPHSGVPERVCDYLCAEIDRVRVYDYKGRAFALVVKTSGSFHEQGSNEEHSITQIELVE